MPRTGGKPDGSLNGDRVLEAARGLQRWAVDHALPLWGTAGFDRDRGRFEERLTLDGARIRDVPIRLMVQARQIHSYGMAARRRWYGGAQALVEAAFGSMVRDFHRRDGGGGWIFSIRRDGRIEDPRRDLYAHAFVLLAVASYVQTTARSEALALADSTLAYLDAEFRAPQGGGFVDAVPAVDAIRRQNPHMHMLEGLLALWRASGNEVYLTRARQMVDLFRSRFFQPGRGVLVEYFDAHLKPLAGPLGEVVEPGHHYEWIWLLRWFERETGEDVQAHVDALYAHADANGHDGHGLIVDELLASGATRDGRHRAWPVTEAIKANLVEAAANRPGAAEKAVALIGTLQDRFLASTPAGGWMAGGWMDRLDKDGNPATDFMPASTLYHVLGVLDELARAGALTR